MLALMSQEQARVEENMGLVGMVLRDYIHTPPPGSIYTEEDLYQIGCIGLCKAVYSDKAGHSAAFSTYACRLIRNEIYDALEYSTRHSREQATAPEDLPHVRLDDELEQHMLCGELFDQLDRAEATSNGNRGQGHPGNPAAGAGLYKPGDRRAVPSSGQPCDRLGGQSP